MDLMIMRIKVSELVKVPEKDRMSKKKNHNQREQKRDSQDRGNKGAFEIAGTVSKRGTGRVRVTERY